MGFALLSRVRDQEPVAARQGFGGFAIVWSTSCRTIFGYRLLRHSFRADSEEFSSRAYNVG
jgi:hypothetical protein